MNIRLQFAYEVAETIGAKVLREHCPRCKFPFLEKPQQGFPFCWGCTTDRQTAHEGRALLLKIKLREEGIIIQRDPLWRMSA